MRSRFFGDMREGMGVQLVSETAASFSARILARGTAIFIARKTARQPPRNYPIITGRISVGWKLAVKERWSPMRKAEQTP